jgi:hypothetical protein
VTEEEALQDATLACESALAEYQAGLLGDSELRLVLERDGIAMADSGTWLLDVESGRWRRYEPVPADRQFDEGTLRRWRAGLRQLRSPVDAPFRP